MRDLDFWDILMIIIIALVVIFVGINIFWIIYAHVKYGGCNITEIPAWAIPYLFGGRK